MDVLVELIAGIAEQAMASFFVVTSVALHRLWSLTGEMPMTLAAPRGTWR